MIAAKIIPHKINLLIHRYAKEPLEVNTGITINFFRKFKMLKD